MWVLWMKANFYAKIQKHPTSSLKAKALNFMIKLRIFSSRQIDECVEPPVTKWILYLFLHWYLSSLWPHNTSRVVSSLTLSPWLSNLRNELLLQPCTFWGEFFNFTLWKVDKELPCPIVYFHYFVLRKDLNHGSLGKVSARNSWTTWSHTLCTAIPL